MPRFLLDQLVNDFYNVDDLLSFVTGPLSALYIILDRTDKEDARKGFIWLEALVLQRALMVTALSIDKEWLKKQDHYLRRVMIPWVRELARKAGFKRFIWDHFARAKDVNLSIGRTKIVKLYCVEV